MSQALTPGSKCPTCGHYVSPPVRRGSAHPHSKLTEPDVAYIRKAASDGESHQFLAEMYEVSKSTITRIVQGKSWKHTL